MAMRIPFIAGNWKMFKTKKEAKEFAEEFRTLYKDTDVRTAICAPFTQLDTLKEAFAGTSIGVGAQNVHFEDEGAFTGEISLPMLKEIGVDYCVIGHSERRQYFNETDETVNLKLKKLLKLLKIRMLLSLRKSPPKMQRVRIPLLLRKADRIRFLCCGNALCITAAMILSFRCVIGFIILPLSAVQIDSQNLICGCGETGRHVRFRSRYVIGIIRQQSYCAKSIKI